MKVGIDASMLIYQGSGVATYTFNLIKSLLVYFPQHEYRIFYSSLRQPKNVTDQLKELESLGGKIYALRFPPRVLNFLWNKNHFLPVEWLIGKVDVFFSSDFLRPPLKKSTKGITTIHDLTWKIYPKLHTKGIVQAHARKLAKTIRFHDQIIVDSQNTKKDLLKFYPLTKKNNRLLVIYPGVSEKLRKITSISELKKTLAKYGVRYPINYLLYVGAIEPRKNLDKAVQVFSQLIKKVEYKNFKFYIVGRAGWKNQKVFQLIDDLGLKDKVIFFGFVAEQDLSAFYSAAAATIYLSEYEGFGLPPLESAKCGTPTLLYANSSLVELFPPSYLYAQRGQELTTLIKLLANKNINVEKYAQNFTWSNTVKNFARMIDYDKQ